MGKMVQDRTYLKIVTFAAAALAAEVALTAPIAVNAASTSGVASVHVVAAPSALGALSSFEIGISAPTATEATVLDVTPGTYQTSSDRAGDGLDRMRPALFSISGLPDQTFSIIVPSPGVTGSGYSKIEFVSFEHNAGITPTIGATGQSIFAVGAVIKVSDPRASDNASSGGGDFTTASGPDAPASSPDYVVIPKVDPFGVQTISSGYLNILVSYN